MDSKPIWQSKTFWASVIIPTVTATVPAVRNFVATNPTAFVSIWGVLAIALRYITKGKVTLTE